MTGPNDLAETATIREVFAAMAMQGLLAGGCGRGEPATRAATIAVDYADALIARLNSATASPARVGDGQPHGEGGAW